MPYELRCRGWGIQFKFPFLFRIFKPLFEWRCVAYFNGLLRRIFDCTSTVLDDALHTDNHVNANYYTSLQLLRCSTTTTCRPPQ